MPDIDLASIEVDGGYQPVLVAADIEHNPVVSLVCGWKGGAQLIEGAELGTLHNLEPAHQRGLAIGMSLPE